MKEKYFVTEDTIEQTRKPGLWKVEYQTSEEERGDFVGLSPVKHLQNKIHSKIF